MANWASIYNVGDPLSLGWQQENLVPVDVGGQVWNVYKGAAPAFRGFLEDLAGRGYPLKSSGGFNYRNIRGSDRLSQHAFGNAIDINAASNALGSTRTDLPADVGALAARYGLEWGGNWKGRPDPMHFEWKGDGQPALMYGQPLSQSSPFPIGTSGPSTSSGLTAGDLFGNRVEASGLMDMPQFQAPSAGSGPMTPERFVMGMIAGQNPLRAMAYNRILGLFT